MTRCVVPPLAIDRGDKVRQARVATAGNFLKPLPECILETDARLVASDHDRALDD
jgi:hypothetical protein